MASADSDGAVRLWDVASAKNTMTLRVEDNLHRNALYSVVFSKDGKTLISAGYTAGHVVFWDVESGKATADFRAHFQKVFSLALSKDGKMLATGSQDKTIKLWDLPSEKKD